MQNRSPTTQRSPAANTSSLQRCAAEASTSGRNHPTTATTPQSPPTLSTQPEGTATGRGASLPAVNTDDESVASPDTDHNSTTEDDDDHHDTSQSTPADSTQQEEEEEESTTDSAGEDANADQPPTPVPIVTEVGADLPSYSLSETDKLLDAVYGDHPHTNDGTHLDGGVVGNRFWFNHWKYLVQLPTTKYSLPKGRVGRRFVQQLAREFLGVRERKWNSERPIVFQMVILQTEQPVRRMKDIRKLLNDRLDLWDQGMYTALANHAATQVQGPRAPRRDRDDETEARVFANTVAGGRLRKAVNNLCRPEGGKGILHPDSISEKDGIPVIDVLRSKHPKMRDPGPYTEEGGAFEPYPTEPATTIPLTVSADLVEKVASRLHGSAGPSGVDSVEFAHWLLHFGRESELLREEMAAWAVWLANSHPPYAAYRAMMANRLVGLDKNPGVRPLGIGEIHRRLWGKCVLAVAGHEATAVCGNHNLCAGLSAGIEGAVHAMRFYWHGDEDCWAAEAAAEASEQAAATSAPHRLNSNQHHGRAGVVQLAEGESAATPRTHRVATDNSSATESSPSGISSRGDHSQSSTQSSSSLEEDEDSSTNPDAVLKIDAKNGFNELNRRAMLWTVRHRWPSGAQYAFNSYRHSAISIVRRPGSTAYFVLSEEGTTQGDVLSMVLYGLTLVPMAEALRRLVPSIMQPWYADDAAMAGKSENIATAMRHLLRMGPLRGYYPEPTKSVLICNPGTERDAAKEVFAEFDFQYSDGDRYLGGFIGTAEARTEWLAPQIAQWVKSVEKLATVAKRQPQAAYAGFTKSLQSQWLYSLRVLHNVGPAFQPIEEAIKRTFIPALLGMDNGLSGHNERTLTALPVKNAGLGIPNPVQSAMEQIDSSRAITAELTDSLKSNSALDVQDYLHQGRETRRLRRVMRTGANKGLMNELLSHVDGAAKRRLVRSSETGLWLTTTPNRMNGTLLSADEFRDSLRIRFGMDPLHLQSQCDGCNQRFSVEHAMNCKKGGLITIRHDDIKDEWHQLCAQALTPSAVSDEPLIYSGRAVLQEVQNNATATAPTPRPDSTAELVPPEHRGDVAAHGFWQRGTTAVFDVRITDTEAPSYRRMDPAKVLARHEKEKKDKYLDACLARRRQFTPLVFSVDGLRGKETNAAIKRVSALLAKKWNRQYSDVCGYTRSRLSIALVRATSMCLRSARDHSSISRSLPPSMDGASLHLYR